MIKANLCKITVPLLVCVMTTGMAETYSIPAAQQDEQQIFWGQADNFTAPAEVDHEELIKATPEYQEIKKKKIKSGTAKYWILLSAATERTIKVISNVGQNTDYDLIAASGYLQSLDPPVTPTDITEIILQKMEEKE